MLASPAPFSRRALLGLASSLADLVQFLTGPHSGYVSRLRTGHARRDGTMGSERELTCGTPA
jgi:hypothetical protein